MTIKNSVNSHEALDLVQQLRNARPWLGKLAADAADAIEALLSQGVSDTHDLSCAADFFDDIEVDARGICKWTDVANAQTNLRAALRCWSAAPHPSPAGTSGMREALQKIVAIDQHEKFVTIECDPAGNTMAVEMVDGSCASIARAALAVSATKSKTSGAPTDAQFDADLADDAPFAATDDQGAAK